jgi:SAM-dependent methyltransferase
VEHYSYAVYADCSMAEGFDEQRFGGPIGAIVARTQETAIAGFLDPIAGRTILDVGTGTGRAAIALARRGATVTGVDASSEMLAVAERRARDAGAQVTFIRGDAHHLDFPDRSFDVCVCLRVLMHTPDWRQSLGELCRVARTQVVFDYPALRSAAALQAVTRRIAHGLGANVEPYRVFRDRAIARELERHRFGRIGAHRQFVLPIALHKRVGSAAATETVENALGRVGLRRLFGSPVTISATRGDTR